MANLFLFFFSQSLEDCPLDEDEDACQGLGEEDEEIDQFNDDTFGSGAVGKWQLSFLMSWSALFKCCLLSALILLSQQEYPHSQSWQTSILHSKQLPCPSGLLFASLTKPGVFLSRFPSSFMICGPQLTLWENQVIREVHIL